MKVHGVDPGICSKASAACCAATNELVVLMAKSRLKSSSLRASGFLGSLGVTEAAVRGQRLVVDDSVIAMCESNTIVDDNARRPELRFHLGKDICHRFGVGKVTADMQLMKSTVLLFKGSGGECDLVTSGCKCTTNTQADVGASA